MDLPVGEARARKKIGRTISFLVIQDGGNSSQIEPESRPVLFVLKSDAYPSMRFSLAGELPNGNFLNSEC